ncbi:ABC transporter ATP-binding protein/permease [Streptomyces sp. LP05-1]|uniref:ABC transporter ATP-binding protein/permease n=1 Tax=Streptomyces pyxinae TaxID=2970734 RepID=A0ABT2CE59_9ACTN|nr:ABC transporter ATP-binding protein [Streptomyces sp. LP05-1]MCS0635692.1 ABC transporter ATP-binding protein/permease [Streptomyces sp. LP05-1]
MTSPPPTATPVARPPGPAPEKPGDGPGKDPEDRSAADRLLWRAARHSGGRGAAILVCSVASALAALAEPAVLGRALDLLLGHDPAAGRLVLLCTALIVAEVVLDAVVALLTGTTNARSTAWLRGRAVTRLLAASPEHAARFAPGDLATRLTANATEAGTVPASAAAGLAALLPPLGGVAALLLIDAWTAAAFLAGVPLLLLLLRAFARSSTESVSRYQRVQSAMAGRLLETLAGAHTVAAAGTAARERHRILTGPPGLPELAAEGRAMWLVYGRAVAHSGVLMPVLVCVVLAVGGIRLAQGALGVGELVAASRYAALAAGVGAVSGLLGAVVRGRAAARRTAEVPALPPLPHGRALLPPGGPGALELRGVTVERAGTAVLADVDLTLPGGATVAVVGRSGAGKSLLAAVAGRLLAPDRGRVLLDGVDLAALDPAELRREVGHAFARPALFGATVGAAVAFGAASPDDGAVRSAGRAAGADGFVQRLPGGYRTPVADAPLSGGERQRLGLARAFAHAGRLLVLDDAMSSLDTVTQREVERALTQQVRPGTRLLVTHRLSRAAGADLVVWLDRGRVRATGPHHELWRDPGYRALFAVPEPDTEPAPAAAPVPPEADR